MNKEKKIERVRKSELIPDDVAEIYKDDLNKAIIEKEKEIKKTKSQILEILRSNQDVKLVLGL